MQAVILAGGQAKKIWPYNEIRNKAMVNISNRPVIDHTVKVLLDEGIEEILILGSSFISEIKHFYRNESKVKVVETLETKGSAKTLAYAKDYIKDDFLIFFGDTYINPCDLKDFVNSSTNTMLVSVVDDPKNHIIALGEDYLEAFMGHARGFKTAKLMLGLKVNKDIFNYLEYNRGTFSNTKVGVATPNEFFLEESLNDYAKDKQIKFLVAKYKSVDIDKPWQILDANETSNRYLCSQIVDNRSDATIDPSATIKGKVKVGKNVTIGKNVFIEGNVIIGDNTFIDNGATIGANVVIGENVLIRNYCKIGEACTIGDDSIIEQTAEFLGGVLMHKVYLYHHGEFYGLAGDRCDLGAGTVCGTLRFDDGPSSMVVNGRREIPKNFATATYLGDYTRTGVGVIFQPGAIVGVSSAIGAGIVVNKVVPSRKLLVLKQEIEEKDWGENKYGW